MLLGVMRAASGDPNAWEASIAKFEARDPRSLRPAQGRHCLYGEFPVLRFGLPSKQIWRRYTSSTAVSGVR